MTSFVHLNYSTQHPGVARVESAMGAVQQLRQGFSGGLITSPLSAVASFGSAASQLARALIRRVDGFSRHVAQARLDWATLGAQLASQSPRSE
ncbi:MAG: hypothetical protein V4772_07340 [Pseudomonadota bacterium]